MFNCLTKLCIAKQNRKKAEGETTSDKLEQKNQGWKMQLYRVQELLYGFAVTLIKVCLAFYSPYLSWLVLVLVSSMVLYITLL